MRRFFAILALAGVPLGAGASCQGLESSERPCKASADCDFPYVCCSQVGLDNVGSVCKSLGECQAFQPFLVDGNPCRRRPPSTNVSEPFYGDCSSRHVCCLTTLTCVANPEGSDPCPPATPEVDGGGQSCTADHECPRGSVCCGIDILRRDGTCTSIKACGGFSLPPGSGGAAGAAGSGGSAGSAGSGGCPEPDPPPTDPACDGIAAKPEPGLVGHWPVENEAGQVACDHSGNGFHATREEGATFDGEGRTQGGRSLSISNNGGLRVRAGVAFDFTPAASFSFWVNLHDPGPGAFLVSRGTFAGDTFNLGVNPPLDLQFFTRSVDGNSSDARSPAGLLALDAWAHLAVVIDETGLQRIYRNGALAYTSTTAVATRTFCGDLLFGKHQSSPTQLVARFDDIKWWNVALTPERVCQEAGGSVGAQGCVVPPAP